MADSVKPMQKLEIEDSQGNVASYECKDTVARQALENSVSIDFDADTMNADTVGSKTVISPKTFSGPGTTGIVPASTTNDTGKYLRGDGRWQAIPYPTFKGAGTFGSVTSTTADQGKFLRADGTWQTVSSSQVSGGFGMTTSSFDSDGYVSPSCHMFTNCGVVPSDVDSIHINFSTSSASIMPDGICQFSISDAGAPSDFRITVDDNDAMVASKSPLQSGKTYQVHLFNTLVVMYSTDYAPLQISMVGYEQTTDSIIIQWDIKHDENVYDYEITVDDTGNVLTSAVDTGSYTSTIYYYDGLETADTSYNIKVIARDENSNQLGETEVSVYVTDPFVYEKANDFQLQVSHYDGSIDASVVGNDASTLGDSYWTKIYDYPYKYSFSYRNGPSTDSYVSESSYSSYEYYSSSDSWYYEVGTDASWVDGQTPTLVPGDVKVTATMESYYGASISASTEFTIDDPVKTRLDNMGDGPVYYIYGEDDDRYVELDLSNLSIFDSPDWISEVAVIINGSDENWLDSSYLGSYVNLTDYCGISPDDVSSMQLRITSAFTTYPSDGNSYQYTKTFDVPEY